MSSDNIKIAVIGGGGWGLALANLLAENRHDVLVWEYNKDYFQTLKDTHSNPILLPGIQLASSIVFSSDFADVSYHRPELIILAIPTQFIRPTLTMIPQHEYEQIWQSSSLRAVINVAKGIELESGLMLHELLGQLLPEHTNLYALSGPSHAEEVARKVPTTVVIAGSDDNELIWLQRVFSNDYFRTYRSNDIIGVEIGGAVKNIIAIAAGIVAGMGFGDNTIGALLSRGIVEIQRLGIALGAKAETFLGLSGIGDLITTATSNHSRNRFVGFEIGKGKTLPEVMGNMKMVAEGVPTTKSVYNLAQKIGIEMPIVNEIYKILYCEKDTKQAIYDLMTRSLKPE